MFTIDNNLQDLKVKERNIFKILYSMNSHPVATPEMSVEEARCYILFFSEGPNLTAFIGLYLPSNDRKFFYAYASNPFPFEAAGDVEEEARQFAEDMGFLLDEINVSGMPAEDRNHWIEDQYIFGYKKPELPQEEEPEPEEEVEDEEEEEEAEEPRLEELKEPEEKRAAREWKPPQSEEKKEEPREQPSTTASPVPPVPEPVPQPPPVPQPGQPYQPPQPYPGYPQPGQPYQPPQPYPGYPQLGQPYQPPQPYPGYPQPGQPYQPPQAYPGYPQQMPNQYPPPQPPELEVPELEEETPVAPARPSGKKRAQIRPAPVVQRRQGREAAEAYEIEEEPAPPEAQARKRGAEDRKPAAVKRSPLRVPASSDGTAGTVTRDKEALARLLSSF